MSKKKLNKKVWYSSEVDVSGNPILPPLADNPEDLEGLHEGELFLHNSDDYPSIWIRTKSGLIKPLIGGQSNTPSYWEVRELPNGDTFLYTSLPIVTQSGVTMYADGGYLNLPSIYDGLPIDNNTIYWENGILKAKGGGGIAESVSWADITGKPEWLLDGKISYSEIEGTPDLSVYALKRSLSEYVTKTELTNLDYADKDWVKEYVVDINTGNITAITKQMVIEALGYTPYDNTNPNGYVTSESIPSLDGYATEDWVIKKGYLTSIPSEYITESELTAKDYATASSVNAALGNKVDKIDGKGLSTEDFTTALKTKLEGLNNYNDTAISNAVTKLRSDFDALVEGDTSTAIDNFNEIIAFLNGVQDDQDLSSIIASIEQQIAAKYTKPSGGIPKSDLVQAVQTSLGKADSALQSHQSIYTLTFQSGTFASGSFTANSGNKTINIPTTTSHVSEGSNLYFTNARAVSALGDTLKSYVTLSGSQTVSGEKNFTGGLKVNGSPIVYDAAKKYWKLEGDLLVTGGVTMYGSDSSFTPSTIMDAIAVDGTTISKDGGVLRVIGGGSGSISEITKQMVIDALGFTPISSSDMPTVLPNPHSLKFGSKLYDGSASKTILASDLGITWDDILGRPTLLSSFTDDVVAGKYLSLTGGTISGNVVWKAGTGHNSILPGHIYRNLHGSTGDVYDHYYPLSSQSINTFANLRVRSNVNGVIKVLRFGGDGTFTWDGNTIIHSGNYSSYALPLSGGTITIDSIYSLSVKRNGTGGSFVAYENNNGNLGFLGVGDDGVPKFAASDGVGKKIWHEGNFTPANYLPLSGGTISGFFAINGSNASYTQYKVNNAVKGEVGWHSNYGIFIKNETSKKFLNITDEGLAQFDGNSLIHSGNVSSQIVEGITTHVGDATNANGDIAKLNSYYSSKGFRISRFNGLNGLGTKNSDGLIVNWPLDRSYGQQWYIDDESHTIQTRYVSGGAWSDWKTIAFTDSNVASATKLQTPRTIWGQSFDGTGNVSGSLVLSRNNPIVVTDTESNTLTAFYLNNGNSLLIGQDIAKKGYETIIYGNQISFAYGNAGSVSNTALYISPSGNVGIGTTNPSAKLDVHGQIAIDGLPTVYSNGVSTFYAGNKAVTSYFGGNNVHLRYGASETTGLILNSEGNVGIGTTEPLTKLRVDGVITSDAYHAIGNNNASFVFDKNGIHNTGIGSINLTDTIYFGACDYTGKWVEYAQTWKFGGNVLTTGGITMYSQRSLKNVVDERGLSLEELRTIKPTRYTWKDGRDNRIHFGGIADDIQQVLPEVVYNANGVLTMDYGNAGFAIASSLIKPVIDHEQRIKALEKENEELKQEIKRLRA